MREKRKEEIIMATLKLASAKGLKAVSMSMIAEEIGIKKPSLYNHFKSKDEIINEMYLFLRKKAQIETQTQLDYAIFENKSASQILSCLVKNYIALSNEPYMQMFYKVIYSEMSISPQAAKIMTAETEKMIEATKQVFIILENKKLLKFENIKISALSFALTIHSLIDYMLDIGLSNNEEPFKNLDLISEFIDNFCIEHKFKE